MNTNLFKQNKLTIILHFETWNSIIPYVPLKPAQMSGTGWTFTMCSESDLLIWSESD